MVCIVSSGVLFALVVSGNWLSGVNGALYDNGALYNNAAPSGE